MFPAHQVQRLVVCALLTVVAALSTAHAQEKKFTPPPEAPKDWTYSWTDEGGDTWYITSPSSSHDQLVLHALTDGKWRESKFGRATAEDRDNPKITTLFENTNIRSIEGAYPLTYRLLKLQKVKEKGKRVPPRTLMEVTVYYPTKNQKAKVVYVLHGEDGKKAERETKTLKVNPEKPSWQKRDE